MLLTNSAYMCSLFYCYERKSNMFALFMFLVTGVIFFGLVALLDRKYWSGGVVLGGIVFFLVIQGVTNAWYTKREMFVKGFRTRPLRAIKPSQGISGQVSGNFLYIKGSINSEPIFTAYVEHNGFYRLKSYPANRCYIREQKELKEPYVKICNMRQRKIVKENAPLLCKAFYMFEGEVPQYRIGGQVYVFYVPDGSVVHDINLDLTR